MNVPRLDRTAISVDALTDPSDEKEYWKSKTPQERMEALELLRQIHYGYDPTTSRLPKSLKLLTSHEVRYLVIGGYAVNFHGLSSCHRQQRYPDRLRSGKCGAAANVLRESGFRQATSELFSEPGEVIRMGVPPVRIGVLRSISGVQFQDCFERRTVADMGGVLVNLMGPEDLKVNKEASGRRKDLADQEQLP